MSALTLGKLGALADVSTVLPTPAADLARKVTR